MTPREFMKLPINARRKLMEESVTPELIAYYQEQGFVATNNQTITLDVDNDYAAGQLLAILQRLQSMGRIGMSRHINFDDGRPSIMWDGDGACRVNMIALKSNK